ncbi:hypothetical protein [Streptomyces sp. CoH27]|uniref:hypothetical protein n=1 Tax=Streptomyces sp. CoH27 TaxID=2875763 RepID=UPI001CD65699|nr:hypothetical protein [Streptomyces sp. CoH27]
MTAVTPSDEPGSTPEAPTGLQETSQLNRVHRELPAAEQAEIWERVVQGAGERILRLVEMDFERQTEEHRQWCLDQIHQRRMDLANLVLRATGVLAGSAGLAGYLWVAKYFVDHGAAVPAAGMLGGGIAAIAAMVVRTQNRKP